MIHVLKRIGWHIARHSWLAMSTMLAVLFFGGWYLMHAFEGESDIVSPEVFWWFFVVTGTTVGYGDFSPLTSGGRFIAMVIMIGGIGLFAAFVGKVADSVLQISQRRNKGMLNHHFKNHLVIFGYRRGETEELVSELLADASYKGKVVLCSSSQESNPLPNDVEFVHGELTSSDVLSRACTYDAQKIIVHGSDDNQTLAIGIAVSHVAPDDVHIVAYFENAQNAEHLLRVDPQIECVTSLSVSMLAQAAQDPGSTTAIKVLVSNLDAQCTQYRMDVPVGFSSCRFGDLMDRMKKKHNATIIGLDDSREEGSNIRLNPDSEVEVHEGMSVFYISEGRLNPQVLL